MNSIAVAREIFKWYSIIFVHMFFCWEFFKLHLCNKYLLLFLHWLPLSLLIFKGVFLTTIETFVSWRVVKSRLWIIRKMKKYKTNLQKQASWTRKFHVDLCNQYIIITIGAYLYLKYYRAPRFHVRCVIIVLVEWRCTDCTNKWSPLLENNVNLQRL